MCVYYSLSHSKHVMLFSNLTLSAANLSGCSLLHPASSFTHSFLFRKFLLKMVKSWPAPKIHTIHISLCVDHAISSSITPVQQQQQQNTLFVCWWWLLEVINDYPVVCVYIMILHIDLNGLTIKIKKNKIKSKIVSLDFWSPLENRTPCSYTKYII